MHTCVSITLVHTRVSVTRIFLIFTNNPRPLSSNIRLIFEETWSRWQLFATIAPCAHIACLFNDIGKFSMLRFNSTATGHFRGKKFQTTALVKKPFFNTNSSRHMFSFERSLKWPFLTTIVVVSISYCTITLNARYAKNVMWYADFTAIYINFSFNSYWTSAKVKSIP